ncbi:MAG TPA: PEP-CTERM sorting domain-containing protein [Candidatus Competibacteraceae bacterium]|nr:PEP-CTERM sorting domain-containing protein [Candidatus Competibacteraceae bacterium]MCP5134815.1 PEP-CTERM sorting domain-containing protein [Gammaproteobacteria bacterium]HRY18755.1 PEP-CTERM sorting domain-containing protein [Candidatus Competibacteraceae bacterium]
MSNKYFLSSKVLIIIILTGGFLISGISMPTSAAIITFDDLISGETSYGFDGDGDGISDVLFTTLDPFGFNTIGPGSFQSYIDEPGLEGTTLLSTDLRVDFLRGAIGNLSFGFALNSAVSDPAYFASLQVFDATNTLLATQSVVGNFSPSTFPEGQVSAGFSGEAAYATFNFTSQFGRYIIDNFQGTFGSTERPSIPEPTTLALFGLGLTGLGYRRWRKA